MATEIYASFTEISVDQITCDPSRLQKLSCWQKLYSYLEQPHIPHLMKPHIRSTYNWSIYFCYALGQQKIRGIVPNVKNLKWSE